MEELIWALKIRKRWNKMPIEEFLKYYHQYLKLTPEETGFDNAWVEKWKFAGLLNTDILTLKKLK